MKQILLGITSLFCTCFFMAVSANPIVAPGGFNPSQVNIQQQGNQLIINQSSHSTMINWHSFNINRSEITTFNQPSRSSVAVNRIDGANGASQIYGTLNANGRIVLINQAGIYFGPGSFVNVGSIIASTSDMTKFDEHRYVFDIPSKYPNAAIVNRGTIRAADYGLVALIGNRVENDGNITAHAGTVVMGAGNKFTLDFVGDQLLNFSIDEAASGGSSAQGIKDLGTVHVHPMVASKILDRAINTKDMPEAMHFAQASNGDLIFSNGKIDVSATKSGQAGGKVKLLASNVKVKNATIDASGDSGGGEVLIGGNYQGKGPEFNASSTSVDANTVIKADAVTKGNGGKVIVWSDGDTSFHGSISAVGGALGGNGGFVETSGHHLDVNDAKVNLLASNGKTGTWLLDPTDLTISAGATSNVSTLGNTYTGDANFTTSTLNVSTLTTALNSANVVVQTTGGGAGVGSGDIIVGTPIGSGGNPAWTSGNTLTLSAYRNIQLNNNITSSGAAEVILQSDNTGTGTGTITGSGVITTASGTAKFYYNPSSYTTPTDFSGNVSGTTLTAYMLVNNVTQLQDISTNTTGSYALGRDIDASATSGWNGGLGFAPIASFLGQLDGQNHTISDLFINRPSEDNVGLIGTGFALNASFIANLGLSNPNITGHSNVGGIVGYLEPDAAGITPIQQTYVSGGSISGADFVGGLVGQLFAGSSFPGTVITDVYNTSNVSGGSYVGGIVGWAGDLVTIQNAYNKGSVTGVTAGGNASTGGILGYSFSSTILNSFNTGAISGGDLVGGLVGYADIGNNVAGNTVIQDSYNLGSVTGGTFAGGIAGAGLTPVFTNVFNSGYVSGSSGSGGLAFDTSGGTTTNGYWDTQTSGQSSSDGGTGMTTAALQAGLPSGFSGPTWSIIAGYSYPYLSSFYSGTPQAVSGFAPGGSAGASGLSGSTVQIATNGVNLSNSSNNSLTMGSVTTGNNGYYYFFEPDGVAANSFLLTYLTSGGSANAVTSSSTASVAGLNMAANTVTVGDASTQTLTNTNALLGSAKGALSSNILYSVTGSDLTLNSGISLSSTSTTTYDVDGNITASGSGNVNFGGPVSLAAASPTITVASGDITFNGTITGVSNLNLVGTGTNTLSLLGNETNTWTIGGANDGTIGISGVTGTATFTDMANLIGGSGADSFTISGGTLSGSLNGSGGTNTLTGDNVVNTWSVTSANAGSVTGVTGGFSNIQNLVGGTNTDSFTLNGGTLSGSINGSGGTNTLTGDNVANTWSITSAGGGSVTGVTGGFTNIQNLVGGSSTDNFNISGGTLSGSINGGGGSNTITANNNLVNTWNINGANAGAVTSIGSGFTNIQNLVGGTNTDNFTLVGGTLSGSINGGSGTNTLTGDNVANTWSVTSADGGSVTGVTGGFSNIQNLVGGSSTDSFTLNGGTLSGSINGSGGTNTLTGDNVANTWSVTGSNAGSVTGVTGGFTNIQNLVGGSSTDNFNISGGTLSGSINGGGGNNTITANNNLVNTWNIAGVNLGGATSIGSGFTNIQNLVGGTNTDTFTFFAGASIAGNLTDTAGTNDYIFSNGSSIGGNLTGSGNDDLSVAGFTTPVTVSLAGSTPLALVAGTISGISQFTGTDAGSGTNSTIEGPVGSNNWIFTGGTTNTGTINGSISFFNFGNVANNSSNNTFTFQNNANLTGNLTGSGSDTLNLSAFASPTVNLSTNTATGIGGTFSGINNFIGAGSSSSLVGPASNTTWSSTGTDSGTAGNSTYSNFGNVTGGSGVNTFIFTNSSVINGLIDGGSGLSNVIDFSGYAQPLTLTLTSLNSGNFKDSSTLAMVANFVNFTNIVGPVNSAIQLPSATTNTVIFKPFGITQPIAQVNGILNFFFSQFSQIYGGSALDSVDLSHVTINNPSALFLTDSGGHSYVTYSIGDPIDVTFFDISDFRGIPTSSSTGNITETLTQGVTMGSQALGNAPASTTPTTSPASMVSTATQAIDTAFGNTKVSNEKPGGGCGAK